jgi:hypothetical protein
MSLRIYRVINIFLPVNASLHRLNNVSCYFVSPFNGRVLKLIKFNRHCCRTVLKSALLYAFKIKMVSSLNEYLMHRTSVSRDQ